MCSIDPILLISPDGMLGRAYERLLQQRGTAFSTILYPQLDLTVPDSVERAIENGTATVINCSAYTDVDAAETDEATATAINGLGIGLLAERCRSVGATLMHFSTDYVFDGCATKPYATDHPISPVNAYGRSKAAGESAIRKSGCDHLIVRTSWLYAPWANNFVRTMVKLGEEKDSLRVVDDQRGRPTSAEYLAERSLELLERGAHGTFHVTDGGSCTWFEFAAEIMRQTGSACRIEPCTSDEFPRPAARPAFSTLDLGATESLLGKSTDWPENLAAVIRALPEYDDS